ncbi:SOS response-associated peptidase family protein [Bifidobacterium magnum]|nr:SOS response-associated peptidase family protein [Bifidobacterium magnum]
MVELWAVLPYCEAMCAHYTGFSDEDIDLLVAQLMGEEPQSQETQSQSNQDRKRIDVYPQQVAPVIVPTFDTSVGVPQFAQGTLERADLEWGYSSQWNPRPIFNTRIESADKPIWRSSMEHGRCVIACRSFYESSGTETRISERTGRPIKQQYIFTIPNMPVIFIGGIRRDDEYSMVTTRANALMEPVHARMPLILHPTELTTWLGPDYMRLADRSQVPLALHKAD